MVVEDTPDLREFLVKNFEDTYGVLSAKTAPKPSPSSNNRPAT